MAAADLREDARPQAGATVLALRGVAKRFGGVHALRGVDLDIQAGRVTGLLGENGAGKSTLVKIITGVIAPDGGEILLDGEPQRFASPRAARERGIAATFQEPMVFPDLSVAENVFAGRQATHWATVDWSELRRATQAIFDELGIALDPRTPVHQLGVADRQLTEIAKALSIGARVLILDEPTAVLSAREVDHLFGIVRTLRERGVALLFITHKLDELEALADRVVVMRDGRDVTERAMAETKISELIPLMVGREVSDLFPERPLPAQGGGGKVILDVKGLTRRGYFEDVSFSLRQGEILGFAGLVGAGRTEVARALFGIDPIDSGEVELEGMRFVPRSPRHAIRCGLAYLPENRVLHGLVPTMKVPLNITMSVWRQLTTLAGILKVRQMRRRTEQLATRVELQAGRVDQLVSTLSGGNQQKVVLGKWLAASPRVLILDEPTHGIDVGTKPQLLKIVADLARSGVGIVLISSELEEVLAMSTRLIVMHRGRVAAELDCPAERNVVMEAASGLAHAEVAS